jgi:hypothetical protein
MKISKYFYIYIGMALFFLSLIFIEEEMSKGFFVFLTLLFSLSLLYDFLKGKLIFKKPNLFILIIDLLILLGSFSNLFNLFGYSNLFVIIFITSFLLKIFFIERLDVMISSDPDSLDITNK